MALVTADASAGASAASPLTRRRCLRLGIFGCPLATGNRGVAALGISTILGLAAADNTVELTLFDYGPGERREEISAGDKTLSIRQVGCYYSRRYYRRDNLASMLFAARLGLRPLHPMLRELHRVDAVLDISGGDSFADLYGARRFRGVVLPKLVAMELGVPLVLLPQTYGPYRTAAAQREASQILRSAQQVWARDEHSLQIARELLGDAFSPSRHRCGVDVAFGLPAQTPRNSSLVERMERFKSEADVLLGLNVSGLLYCLPGDVMQFGFRDSYAAIIDQLTRRLLDVPGARILMIPHVSGMRPVTPGAGAKGENDAVAQQLVLEKLPAELRQRVFLVPGDLNVMELKWLIGRCDWFCGTRMHACIAAISQGVPCSAIAYSDKTRGVFDTAGIGEVVVDPRELQGKQVVERLLQGFELRMQTRGRLEAVLPRLRLRVAQQFNEILTMIGR